MLRHTRIILMSLMMVLSWSAPASAIIANVITTVVGTGVQGYSGDGLVSTSAQLNTPRGFVFDGAGNMYITDSGNGLIRKVSTAGIITTVAGTGTNGFSGDGGSALAAQLDSPLDVALDSAGNLYILEFNSRVRMVSVASGIISTVVGTGVAGYSGDGGAANLAQLWYPDGIMIDSADNIYIADTGGARIRMVTAGGIISTIAGTGVGGYSGDGGPSTVAQLSAPMDIAGDANGNLYIADTFNNRVRKIATNGTITTIAGTGVAGYSGDGGLATAAQLNWPQAVDVDGAGNIYIADTENIVIRRIWAADGTISTVAGTGTLGNSVDGGVAIATDISKPKDLTIDGSNILYFSDGHRVRKVSPPVSNQAPVPTAPLLGTAIGTAETSQVAANDPNAGDTFTYAVTTVATNGAASVDGNGLATYTPNTGFSGSDAFVVTVSDNGGLSGAVTVNVDVFLPGIITSVAGTGVTGFSGDLGPATAATYNDARGVVSDAAGNFYISDGVNNRIRKVDVNGIITTIAGTGVAGYSGDGGPATAAQLNYPHGVAMDSSGNLYIADNWNNRVRMIDTNGIITTVAGTGVAGYSGDGGLSTAANLSSPIGVAVGNGYLYIADANNSVRRVDVNGIITTIAGTGVAGYSGDGGPAVVAQLNYPRRLALDSTGNLYISDHSNNRVRKVDVAGIITTVAGTGVSGYSGDGGLATVAKIAGPYGVAVDSLDNLYFSDSFNHCIRRVATDNTVSSVIGSCSVSGFLGDDGPAVNAQLFQPQNINLDSAGNLFLVDGNNRIRKVTPGVANQAPIPTAPQLNATVAAAGTSQVAANDPNVGDTFTYAVTTGGSNGLASVNGSGLTSYTSVVGFTGNDSFVVTVTDNGGLSGTVIVNVNVADSTLPTGTISVEGGVAAVNTTSVSLTLSCSDNVGCVQMQFSNDNTTWSSWAAAATTAPWTLSTGDAVKTVYARFRDTAGNVSVTTNDVIELDTIAPVAPIITAPVSGSSSNSSTARPTISGSAEVDAAVIIRDYTTGIGLTAATGGNWSLSAGIAVLSEGVHSFTATATDAAGNTSVASVATLYTVDTTAPVIVGVPLVDVYAEPTGTNTIVALTTPTVTDAFAVTITNDAPATFLLGTTVVIWTATDAHGNTTTSTQNVVVQDTTIPVFVGVPLANVNVDATGATTVTLSAPIATDAFPLTVISDAPATFPLGTTVVTWTATDANGNSATATQNVIVSDSSATSSPPSADSGGGGCLAPVQSSSQTYFLALLLSLMMVGMMLARRRAGE